MAATISPATRCLPLRMGALVGERLLLGLCTIAAAGLFGLIVQRVFGTGGARVAAVSFALGASVTMLSGRVAFSLGLAVGLLAVVALQRGRPSAAVRARAARRASPARRRRLPRAGRCRLRAGGRGQPGTPQRVLGRRLALEETQRPRRGRYGAGSRSPPRRWLRSWCLRSSSPKADTSRSRPRCSGRGWRGWR